MTQPEIKSECETCYAQIKAAEETLIQIRSVCKHPNTFNGNYMWRVGSILPATICSDCGEVITFNIP